ncbi:hypothetical protein GC209_10940 [bacterium]|nr:hypothetical protein [bacterium]
MIRFAMLVAQGAPDAAALAAYEAAVPAAEAKAARALLSGQRPRRIASADALLAWVAAASDIPAFLVEACRAATTDKAELAALLLPQAPGTPPDLIACLAALQSAEPARYLDTASRLPPEARLIFNRLAAGSFRTRLAVPIETDPRPGTCLALLTMIDPAGPEATFALPHGNALVALTRLRLTLPETPEIIGWSRTHTTDRFGPQRQVTPHLVFELAYTGTRPNKRRKSGFDLVGAELVRWHRDLTPDRATALAEITPETDTQR